MLISSIVFIIFLSFNNCQVYSAKDDNPTSSLNKSIKSKIIIDTDCGIDDTKALILLLGSDEASNLDILGITTVLGVAGSIQQTVVNVYRTLRLFGKQDKIPVFQGAPDHILPKSKLKQYPDRFRIHGEDGLGDRPNIFPPPDPDDYHRTENRPSAAQFIVETVQKYPGEVTLLTLGPLTNLALAIKIRPNLPNIIKQAIVMGGSIYGKGNLIPLTSSEYNFYVDPEAAYIVLESSLPENPVKLINWELITNRPVSKEFMSILKSLETNISMFARMISEDLFRWKQYKSALCDEIVAALAIRPDLAIKTKKIRATVELTGQLSRGQIIIDWFNTTGLLGNVECVEDYETAEVERMFLNAVGNSQFNDQ